MFIRSNLKELANLSYSAVCEETLSEKMKEITVIRNSIMEQLPKKDGLIRTNPDNHTENTHSNIGQGLHSLRREIGDPAWKQ